MALIFMIMTFVVFVFYGAFAALARQYVINNPNVMKGVKSGSVWAQTVSLPFRKRKPETEKPKFGCKQALDPP